MLCQTLSHTLKLAPHERPSTQPLTKNPQQLCYFLRQTLTKDPQQVWQTLKNFDYPTVGHLSFTYENQKYQIDFGLGFLVSGILPIYDFKCAASGAWLADGTLYIKVHVIDSSVGSIKFQLSFQKDSLTIFMRKQEETLFQEFDGHIYCTI